MNQTLSGIYLPGNSIIHRLDARVKLFSFFTLVIAALFANSWAGYLVMAAISLLLVFLSRLEVGQVIGSLGRMKWFLMVIFMMNMLFYSPENAWSSWWVFTPSHAGLLQAVNIVFRVCIVVILGNILNNSTPPVELTRAMETLLYPLSYLYIPTAQIAMIISVAVQFIPTLMMESEQIRKAQIARGARFESKKLTEKAAAIGPLVVPIIVSAFRRADELALAMEARGYQCRQRKPLKKPTKLTRADAIAVAVSLVICLSQLSLL